MPLPKVIIEAPPVTPLPYGILSAAVVRDPADPHEAGGVTWEPQFCGSARTTLAACLTSPSDAAVSVDDTGEATWTVTVPNFSEIGEGVIDWGDGSGLDTSGNWTHTYAAPGDYTITFTGENQFTATVTVTVEDGEASGPFDAAASFITDKSTDERAGWVESEPFTIYHISTCRLPGSADREAYATRALQLGEGRGIEFGMAEFFSGPDAEFDAILNAGAADSAIVALARLEQGAGERYGGVATIHMSRAVASFLLTAYALETRDGKLYTKLGNLVVAGAVSYNYPGSPEGETTGAGQSWMFATGTVVVTRGAVTTSPAVYSTGGEITNEYSVLAERPVSVGWECFLIAHLVSALDAA